MVNCRPFKLAKWTEINKNFDFRTSSAVPIATLPYKGLGGLAFGGPKRDNLLVVAFSDLIDVLSATLIGNSGVGISLYKITNVGAKGLKNSRLIL